MRFANIDDPIEFLPEGQRRIIREHQSGTYVELGPLFGDLGIKWEMADLPNFLAGEASYAAGVSKSGFVVRVNKRHAAEKKRFTAAHELGHCILHGGIIRGKSTEDYLLGSLNRDTTLSSHGAFSEFESDPFLSYTERAQETEADNFAAALLMPAPILNKLWRGGFKEPAEMAHRLGVSMPALRRRMRDLEHPSSGRKRV